MDRIPLKIMSFLERHGRLIVSAIFLVVAFCLLRHYGLPLDSPKNFNEGRINLNYLLTGQPLSHTDHTHLAYQIHGAFFFMIFEFCSRVLISGFDWADRITSKHVLLPVLVCFFVNFLYRFLKKKTGRRTAGIACAVLLTYPHFFGHMFNNIKDIPLFVFFSMTILCFFDWTASGFTKTRALYGGFVSLALAMNSKVYALLAPAILLLWILILHFTKTPVSDSEQGPKYASGLFKLDRWTLLHAGLGVLFVAAFVGLFFAPAFYGSGEKMKFLAFKTFIAKELFGIKQKVWSFYPFVQILFVTPLLTLVAAAAGLADAILKKIKDPLTLLMGTWLGVVLVLACTPVLPSYNGIRLFLNFLVPFSFFAARGIDALAGWTEKRFSWKKPFAVAGVAFAVAGFQIAGIVSSHPYEALYFNALAGGLKGAQQKRVADAEDYWFLAFREAVDWVNRNAPKDAYLMSTNFDGKYALLFYPIRPDIGIDTIRSVPVPRNSFVLVSESGSAWMNLYKISREAMEAETSRMIKAREIRSQGGLLLTIYYKP